jgi:hypothetical protein
MICVRDGELLAWNLDPDAAVSMLRYATMWSEIQDGKSSPHSVLPTSPYCDESQIGQGHYNMWKYVLLQCPSLQKQLQMINMSDIT